jgi:hypothetical protein
VLPHCWEERPLTREWETYHWAACHRLDANGDEI